MRRFFNKASDKFTHMRRKTANGFNMVARVGKHTISDLRTPKEIGMFIVAALAPIPGVAAAYIIYRVAKYKNRNKPVNDNSPDTEKSKMSFGKLLRRKKPQSPQPPTP